MKKKLLLLMLVVITGIHTTWISGSSHGRQITLRARRPGIGSYRWIDIWVQYAQGSACPSGYIGLEGGETVRVFNSDECPIETITAHSNTLIPDRHGTEIRGEGRNRERFRHEWGDPVTIPMTNDNRDEIPV